MKQMQEPRFRKGRAMLLALVIVAAGILPVAYSGHLNDLLDWPGLSDTAPSTGIEGFDDAVAAAAKISDDAVAELDALLPSRDEPQVPAYYFFDGFEPTSRLGGWGEWDATLGPKVGWHEAEFNANNMGQWFWDPTTGFYPTGTGPDRLHTFLVSPRISLEGVPVDTFDARHCPEDVRDSCPGAVTGRAPETADGAGVPAVPEAGLAVHFNHRYNFATRLNADDDVVPQDWGRVVVYVDEPPTPGTIGKPAAEVVLGNTFTGTEDSFHEISLDLSRWAGHDVWIGFKTDTSPVSDLPSYFNNVEYFDTFAFFGWQLESVWVEGPAHVHNVRIDEVLNPYACAEPAPGEAQCVAPSGDGQDPYSILMLNRGQVTEDVRPTLRRTDESKGSSQVCPPVAGSQELRMPPGDLRRVEFQCDGDLVDGRQYTFEFAVAYEEDDLDGHQRDNMVTLSALAQRNALIKWDPLKAGPLTSDENQPRLVELSLRNAGLSREPVLLELRVVDENGAEVTDDPSYVDFVANSGPVAREFSMSPTDERSETWEFLLPFPGAYEVAIDVYVNEALAGTVATRLSTLVSDNILYKDPFDGQAVAEPGFVVDGTDWAAESWSDNPPPGADVSEEPGLYVWELPRQEAQRSRSFIQFGPDAEDFPPDDGVVGIDVEITYNFDFWCTDRGDVPPSKPYCPGNGKGVQLSVVLDRTRNTQARTGLSPAESANLDPIVENLEHIVQKIDDKAVVSADTITDDPTHRFAYYSGRWITEEYSIETADFLDDLESLPSSLALRIWEGPGFTDCTTSTSQSDADRNCPGLRISKVTIDGTTASGATLSLVRFDVGREPHVGTVSVGRAGSLSKPNECTDSNPAMVPGSIVNQGPGQIRGVECGEWIQRPVEDLSGNAQSSWTNIELAAFAGGSGVWTNANPADLTYAGRDGRRDALLTPVFRIPDSGAPSLAFLHKFNLLGLRFQDDTGMLMVRYFDPQGEEPVTPFLPVAINTKEAQDGSGILWPQSGDVRQAYATNEVCHHGPSECGPGLPDLKDRPMVSENIDLTNLPLLNYTRLKAGSPEEGVNLANPDKVVFETRDLRGEVVQFAFRVETIEGVFVGGPFQYNDKKVNNHAANVGKGEGWYLGEFSITRSEKLGHDLALTDFELTADYDWTTLGIGPGSAMTASFTVENRGLFREENVRFKVTAQDLANDEQVHEWVQENPAGFSLNPGQEGTFDLPFTLPTGREGTFKLLGSVDLHGVIGENLPLVDERPNDNCVAVADGGKVRAGVCSLAEAPLVTVRANPVMRLASSISPEAGLTRFPRELGIALINEGNVPVDGATLEVHIEFLDGLGKSTDAWLIPDGPDPGEARPWTALERQFTSGPGNAGPNLILSEVGGDGRYLITSVLRDGATGAVLASSHVLVDAFENFYSDSFEPNGLAMSPLASGAITSTDPEWGPQQGVSHGDGATSWRFGNQAFGNYSDAQDAVLLLPDLDLSTASTARLSFSHRYEFEPNYDGGRVEASLDGGSTWLSLDPIGGYDGALFASSPLRSSIDSTDLIPAFTGDSRSVNAATDGWVTSEFDLSQLPGFTTPVQLQRLNQEGFAPSGSQFPDNDPSSRVSSHLTWSLPASACATNLDPCWYTENLRYSDTPPHNPAGYGPDDELTDSDYWWTGSIELAERPAGNLQNVLPLHVRVPENAGGPGRQVVVSFWTWTEEGGSLGVRAHRPVWDADDRLLLAAEAFDPNAEPAGHPAIGSVGLLNANGILPPFGQKTDTDIWNTGQTYAFSGSPFVAACYVAMGEEVPNPVYLSTDGCTGSPVAGKDVRLTDYPIDGDRPQAGEVVSAGDADVDADYAAFEPAPVWRYRPDDGDAGADYDSSAAVFLDVDDDKTVSPGDVRITPVGLFIAGTIVDSDDPDVGDDLSSSGAPVGAAERFFETSDNPFTLERSVEATNPETGWVRNVVDLTGMLGQDVYLRIRYQDSTNQEHSDRGLFIDDVESFTRSLSGDPSTILSRTSYPTSSPDWGVPFIVGVNNEFRREFAWTAVDGPTPVATGWNVRDCTDHLGETNPVWWFGTGPLGCDGPFDYPPNALERLVTPIVSLKGVGGSEAFLDFHEHYALAPFDTRRVLVQAVEPFLDEPGPWVEIYAPEPSTDDVSESSSCPAFDWCAKRVEVPFEFIGKEVRFAFEAKTTRLNVPSSPGILGGYHWGVNGVTVAADSLVGQPVQIRLRAASDASLNDVGWDVDNVQVVGFQYGRNVAVLPDATASEILVAPGGDLTLTGEVRNLGGTKEDDLRLALRITPVEAAGGTPDAIEDVEIVAPAAPPGQSSVRLPSLFPAGLKDSSGAFVDRLPYEIRLGVPSNVANANYRVDVLLMTDEASPRPVADDRVGDHERSFVLKVKAEERMAYTGVVVDPPTADQGQPVTLGLTVGNGGTVAVDAMIVFEVEAPEGAIATTEPVDLGTLGPGASEPVSAEVVLGEVGLHRVTARVTKDFAGPTPPIEDSLVLGHILVDQFPIYLQEDFEGLSASEWSSEGMPAHNICGPNSGFRSAAGSEPWRLVDSIAFDGTTSFHFGRILSETPEDPTYPARQDSMLLSPVVDLSALGDTVVQRDDVPGYDPPPSAFAASLSFRYFADTGDNDGVIVQAERVTSNTDEQGFYWLAANYPQELDCFNPVAGDEVLPEPDDERPAYGGIGSAWGTADVPVGGNVLATADGMKPLMGEQVRFGIRFASDGFREASGFTVDSVSISSYGADVTPGEQHFVLRSGADKTFPLLVTNTGPAADVLRVRVDQALSDFPTGIYSVEVPVSEVALEAGASTVVPVRLTVPSDPTLPPSFQDLIVVEVASTMDPNKLARAELHVDQFQPTPLSDLEVLLQRPAGESGRITEQEDARFLLTVSNIGQKAARPTDLFVFACPDRTGDLAADLGSCDDRVDLEVFAVPPLATPDGGSPDDGDLSSISRLVEWETQAGRDRGSYHVVAVVDPQGLLQQANRLNDMDSQALTIDPLEKPDLVVEDLVVLDAEHGTPVTHGFGGQELLIRGTVRNIGDADAEDVVVVLANRFTLAKEFLPRIVPGQSVELSAQWLAKPGNWVVRMQAETAVPEHDPTNNAANWRLAIRPGTLEVEAEPTILHLGPGQTQEVRLTVSNRRDSEVALAVSAQTTSDLSVSGLPGGLVVPRGATDAVFLRVSASPFAKEGVGSVTLTTTPEGSLEAAGTVTIDVVVGRERQLSASAEALVTPPGSANVEVRVFNGGSMPDEARIEARGPDGWNVVVLAPRVSLPPGARASVELAVEIPAVTSPGAYEIGVLAGSDLLSTVSVLVTESPSWASIVEQTRTGTDIVEAWVRVTNTGNAPGVPDLSSLGLGGDDRWSVEPAPAAHASGEARVYHFTIRLSAAAEAGATMLSLPGDETLALEAEPVAVASVEALDWQVLPAQGVQAGDRVRLQLQVKNAGTADAEGVPVRFYVDGVLHDERRIPLAGGETSTVEFTWKAVDGGHVVSAAIGDPRQAVARASAVYVDADDPATIPALPAWFGILVVVAAAMMMGARRSRRDA